jgi:hypothetical protein
MKTKIGIISLGLILLIVMGVLITGFTNKTFFKGYYEVTNPEGEKVRIPLPLFAYYNSDNAAYTATFSTFRSVETTQNTLNQYVEFLQACYDESYFYDSDLDITITRYYVEAGFPLNKISLVYNFGNYCEDEYVLDDNWMSDIIENAEIQEGNIVKCIVENDNVDCDTKIISEVELRGLFDHVSQEPVKRIENKRNISINPLDDYYLITSYYRVNSKGYLLSIFIYNGKFLAFVITDDDDRSKNAIYDIGDSANTVIEDIYYNQ